MGCGSRNEVGRIPRRSYSRQRQAVADSAGGRWLVLEIELWSEPKNQKTAGAAVQSHDTAVPLPCYHVHASGPCVRAPIPRSSRDQSHCGAQICSLVVCLSVVVVAQTCMYAGTTTSEKTTQTGKRFASWKEGGPKWGRTRSQAGRRVGSAQARLPIIIEILDLLQLLHGIVDAIVHRTPPACHPVFAFSPVPASLNTGRGGLAVARESQID
jgi:hypothetical protein